MDTKLKEMMAALDANAPFKVNFVVFSIIGEDIVHGTGYEQSPSELEIAHLREELDTDKEFGLCGFGSQMQFVIADRSVNPPKAWMWGTNEVI